VRRRARNLYVMTEAKTMIRSWRGRLLAACAVYIAVAVVTTSRSASAADFPAAE
jgi:hypothetical protein